MKKIKSKNTQPEIQVRSDLWKLGYRYRIHLDIVGTTDIVFPKKKLAIFIDGCFWHKCPKCFVLPKSNLDYWKIKLDNNVKRDENKVKKLKNLDWEVIRIWEHEIKEDLNLVIDKLSNLLTNLRACINPIQ